MPKRKRSKEEDVDRLQRKIRKLQQKINKKLDNDDNSISSDLEEVMPFLDPGADTPALRPSDWLIEMPEDKVIDNDQVLPANTTLSPTQLGPSGLASSPQPGPSTSTTAAPPEDIATEENVIALDNDVLEILGDDPSSHIKYGPEIRGELASRLEHVSTKGLSKELRRDLVSKYPTPSNSIQIDAPKLNLEIKAAISETVLKRDKGIEIKQKQMTSAISCLSDVINTHITSKNKNNEVLQKLMDVSRILCDIQHADSVTRRNFICFALKPDMKEHLRNTKVDSFLFGENLAETLKSAKAVNRSGAELKAPFNKPAPKQYKPAGSKPLNHRAPPQARRPPGQAPPPRAAPRSREPAAPRAPHPPPPPAHSSRTSAQQNYQRRRF